MFVSCLLKPSKTMTEEKVESSVMPIRIPSQTRVDIDIIVAATKSNLRNISAAMLTEYAPIKSRLSKPFLIKREFKIDGKSISFSPDVAGGGMTMTINESFVPPINIKISEQDKEGIFDLISNLLMFTNSI